MMTHQDHHELAKVIVGAVKSRTAPLSKRLDALDALVRSTDPLLRRIEALEKHLGIAPPAKSADAAVSSLQASDLLAATLEELGK